MDRPPRIVLTTFGSLGDLHPFIAVGLALKARGCDVTIATTEQYRSKIRMEGLGFHAVRPNFEEFQLLDVATKGLAFFVEKMIAPYIAQSYEDLCDVLCGADLAVASGLSIAARLAIAKVKIPFVSLMLYPCLFISPDDPPYLLEFPWLPTIRRTLGARAVGLLMRIMGAELRWRSRAISRFRKQQGLPPAQFDEVFGEAQRADWVVAAYSPCFGPLPRGYAGEVTGFTFFDREAEESLILTKPVADFLANGAPPLVFTLGSILGSIGTKFFKQAAITARQLGMRAILIVGADIDPKLEELSSKDILVIRYVPYSLVFPHAAAIIHHGGIGTIGLGLRAGRPQLVCPFMGDHGDNAERLVRLGAARRLNLKRFTAARAIAELQWLLAEGPTEKAAELAQQVAQEDGARFIADRILTMLR